MKPFARTAFYLLLWFAALGMPVAVNAQKKTSSWLTTNFQARTHYPTVRADSIKYRLFKPANYDTTKRYPIVLALHGIGERGYNNVNQLTLEELAQPWVRDSVQAKHPHFVMIPQCPTNPFWWPSNIWYGSRSIPNNGIVEILDSLKKEFKLDTTRFYVVGLSMGGFGTIELMKWNPNLFAAAVPAAGGGDTATAIIPQYVKTPVWLFHSATDPTVKVDSGSRALVSQMEANLGKPFVRWVSDTGMKNPTGVSLDSLRKAVYVDNANFLYSEVRNVPGSGNTLHQAGWYAAWRHPMLTDWLFSKQKVNGVTVSLNPALTAGSAHRTTPANTRILFRNGGLYLEKTLPGGKALYTLQGKKLEALAEEF